MSGETAYRDRPWWLDVLLRGPSALTSAPARAIVIGLLVVVSRRLGAILVGAGLLVVSAAALVIDVEVGMFGFKDSWSVPYVKTTLYEEVVGAVLLLAAAGAIAWSGRVSR